MSDHRFEQRGLLHAELLVAGVSVHAIVVHFGLIPASRIRQTAQLKAYIAREVPRGAPLIVARKWETAWSQRIGRARNDAGAIR